MNKSRYYIVADVNLKREHDKYALVEHVHYCKDGFAVIRGDKVDIYAYER